MEELLKKYRNRIYGFMLKYVKIPELAEDLTQEVLIKIWKNRNRFLTMEDKESYMLAITRNMIRDHFKKLTQEEKYKEEVWSHFPQTDNSLIRQIQREELTDSINQVVNSLPHRQREIYKLNFQRGMSLKEISKQLDISPFTAKNHLAKALKVIRSKVNPESFLVGLLIIGFYGNGIGRVVSNLIQ
ncbi:RNA polymerase sigma factor [Membranihabitans marinus]|uniref:RNA polymerase sigma factor n=1 Tax=Membranihabitans marinus TaxID=1227546 RepID=UPI001F00B2BE|nr:sigma-70 family RNA polymerase sigma factor [Membranihabitans marinus]